MAMVRHTHTAGSGLSPEQLAEVNRAAILPVTYDEDCPRLTDEQLAEFRPVNGMTWAERDERMREAAPVEAAPARITLSVAPDIAEWLTRNWADSYQEQVNAILRQAMLADYDFIEQHLGLQVLR